MLYLEAQHKAQAEIDRIMGGDRFPTLTDQPNLPYIDALVKEALRWHPVVPLGELTIFRSGYIPLFQERLTEPGVTHVAVGDEVYEGYFIPKGTSIITNIW